MPKSNFDFTVKFFHPPQRTVSCHNGLLDIRTKHTIAQDRLIVAEKRILEAERRKSVSNLQLLAFEQKQMEKKLASLQSQLNSSIIDRSFKRHARSTSEVVLSRSRPILGKENLTITHEKSPTNLNNSNQNLLSLPSDDHIERRSSAYSDGDISENNFFTIDAENDFDMAQTNALQVNDSYSKRVQYKRTFTKNKFFSQFKNESQKLLPPLVAVIPPDDDLVDDN